MYYPPHADDGPVFLVRRTLHANVSEEATQRHNLFQSRCKIGDFTCTMIIDSGSCTNVAAKALVDRLKPPTRPHPRPYKIKWLDNNNTHEVRKQALIALKMGPYLDNIWCGILPMTACQLLLGRPWQFDKKAIHDGTLNTYSIQVGQERFTLLPLPLDSDTSASTNLLTHYAQ